jgi:hypothetical protein
MNQLPFEQQILLALQAVAIVALCIRFWRTGLYRVYGTFSLYLVVLLLQLLTLSLLPPDSSLYLPLWMTSEGGIVCLYALVVLELYSLLLRDLPGIASAARRYTKISLAIAVFGSLLLLLLEKAPAHISQYFLVCDRVVIFSLLVFVLSSVGFLVYYPVPVNRNAVSYSIGFSIYLTAKAVSLLVGDLHYMSWIRPANSLLIGASTGCLLFWLFTLNKQGENKTVVVGHQWDPSDEKRLLSQLQHINDSLLRIGKK